jgi:hypothetical protein
MPDFGIFRGFNEKLFGNKLYAGQLPTQLGLIGSQDFGFDADAQAFFDRVTAAGGTLSATEQLAIDTLVKQMKLDGIWTLMKAIYPLVGGGTGSTAARQAACSQNLKSSSFTGTFTSGWSFASTGATPNGTSAYFNTNFNPSTSGSLNSSHLSVYCRTNLGISGILVLAGVKVASNIQTIVPSVFGANSYNSVNGTDTALSFVYARTDSFILTNRTSSTQFNNWYKNTKLNTTNQNSVALPNGNIWLSGRNLDNTSLQFPDSNEKSFFTIGDGLTDTEASNLYTAVQAFQTTLSRQV